MKPLSAKDLRADLAGVLERVEAGEEFLLIYRSRPVGELVPLRGRKQGRRGEVFYEFLDSPFGEVTLPAGVSGVDLIRADRGR